MKWKNVTMIAGAGIVLLLMFSGCTALGYGVGYLVDEAGAEVVAYLPPKAVAQLDPGDDIAVIMRDGTTRHGSYDGLAVLSDEDLLAEAERNESDGCVENAVLWPGDTINVSFADSDPVDCIYLNADTGRLYYRTFAERRVMIAPYWEITAITFCDGGIISAGFLTQYLDRNFESVFDLQLRKAEQVIHLQSLEIDHVKLEEADIKYRQVFAGAGLVVDVFMISAALGLDPIVLEYNNDDEDDKE